jgi:hypothetical protein
VHDEVAEIRAQNNAAAPAFGDTSGARFADCAFGTGHDTEIVAIDG